MSKKAISLFSTNKNKIGGGYGLAAVCFLFLLTSVVCAQDKSLTVEVSAAQIINDAWVADSTQFIYQDVTAGLSVWFVVDLLSGQVRELEEYPIEPPLSDAESQKFPQAQNVRVSPRGDHLLSVSDGDTGFLYTLTNRATAQHTITSFPSPDEIGFGSLINIEWSADGSHFAIGTLTDAGTRRIAYFSVITPNMPGKSVVYTFDAPLIEGRPFYTADPFLNQLFDVSEDGVFVLLTAQENIPDLDTYSERTWFILWEPTDPAESRALAIPHIEAALSIAAFSAHSPNELYIWTFEGFGSLGGELYRFDVVSGRLYWLAAIDNLYRPSFSPNGEWLSYYTDSGLTFLWLVELGEGELVEPIHPSP